MIESEPDCYHAEQGARAVQNFLGVLYGQFMSTSLVEISLQLL